VGKDDYSLQVENLPKDPPPKEQIEECSVSTESASPQYEPPRQSHCGQLSPLQPEPRSQEILNRMTEIVPPK
jgi:hypothetical protein